MGAGLDRSRMKWRRMAQMRKTLVGLVALLLIVGMASACSDIEDGESASSSSGYTVPEYKDMPDLRHI